MVPILSRTMCKLQKTSPMSLKQFMVRSEILKLYRGFMKLGKMLNEPPQGPPNLQIRTTSNPIREEWTQWVRSEFRIRQHSATDEEATRTLLVHGKRQLQEMERTIMLATNRNTETVIKPPPSLPPHQCQNKNSNANANSSSSSQSGKAESSNTSDARDDQGILKSTGEPR